MQRILIVVFVLCSHILVAQKSTKMNIFNDSNYAIIPFNSSETWVFKDASPNSLSLEDMKIIEETLLKAVNTYNQQTIVEHKRYEKKNSGYHMDRSAILISLKEYKFQLMPVLNAKREKEVWINAFCHSFGIDWKKQIVSVDDGGKCFFNFKINLNAKKYYDFRVNGIA